MIQTFFAPHFKSVILCPKITPIQCQTFYNPLMQCALPLPLAHYAFFHAVECTFMGFVG